MDRSSKKYDWFALGDLNGFFGLMFDNLTVLSFLAGTLVLVFKFPADIVYTKMFPGTAFVQSSSRYRPRVFLPRGPSIGVIICRVRFPVLQFMRTQERSDWL